MLLHRCLHCLAANACEVRFDKKGRPYTVCKVCWTKAFFQSLDPLRGVAVVPQLVESALRARKADQEYARKFDDLIARTIRWVQDNSRPAVGEKAARLVAGDATPLAVPFDATEAKVGT
jgi:hypothetical protein